VLTDALLSTDYFMKMPQDQISFDSALQDSPVLRVVILRPDTGGFSLVLCGTALEALCGET
jgi:hypothetical protein